MTRENSADARRTVGRRRAGWLLWSGLSLLTFVLGSLVAWEALAGPPVFAHSPEVAINTPDLNMPVPAQVTGDILPVTPAPLAMVRGALLAPRPAGWLAAAAQGATATAAALLGRPVLDISPESGPAGTQITLVGQGWPANDNILLRLQDPSRGQMLAEYPLAISDGGGNFTTTFTIPADPPWGQLPALLLWAVSAKTGAQIRAPKSFVVTSGVIAQQALTPTATTTVSTTGTATATPTGTLTPGAGTETPGIPTATPLPAATDTSGTPVPFIVATPLPTPTPFTNTISTFQSPMATPTPMATSSRQASPRLLPPSGGSVLATTDVTVSQATLHDRPDNGSRVVARAGLGAPLGVLGQSVSGEWLYVTTARGASGWILRSATDFMSKAPIVTTR
jgi:hypothetical protein